MCFNVSISLSVSVKSGEDIISSSYLSLDRDLSMFNLEVFYIAYLVRLLVLVFFCLFPPPPFLFFRFFYGCFAAAPPVVGEASGLPDGDSNVSAGSIFASMIKGVFR